MLTAVSLLLPKMSGKIGPWLLLLGVLLLLEAAPTQEAEVAREEEGHDGFDEIVSKAQ